MLFVFYAPHNACIVLLSSCRNCFKLYCANFVIQVAIMLFSLLCGYGYISVPVISIQPYIFKGDN